MTETRHLRLIQTGEAQPAKKNNLKKIGEVFALAVALTHHTVFSERDAVFGKKKPQPAAYPVK